MSDFKGLNIPGKRIVSIIAVVFLLVLIIACVLSLLDIHISNGIIWLAVGGYVSSILYLICSILFRGLGKENIKLIFSLLLSVVFFISYAVIVTLANT